MSKWDDDFDLDDFDAKPANKKSSKPKAKKEEDDFFDLEDQTTSKPNKLPTINNKGSKDLMTSAEDKKAKKSKNVYDDYEEIYQEVEDVSSPKKNISKKPVEESNYYEQLEQIQESKPKNQSNLPKVSEKVSKSYDEEEFYQEIEEVKPPPRQVRKVEPKSPKKNSVPPPPSPPKEQSNYEESFDDYGEDFEEEVKEAPKKSNTITNLKAKDKNVKDSLSKPETKKYAINSNQVFTNKNRNDTKTQPSVPKPPQKENKIQTRNASKKTIEKAPYVSQQPKQLQRSNSRKSMKSNDSRSHTGNSRVTKKYMTQFTTNKHMLQVERTFPDDESKLATFSIDRLTRMNEHVRQMIRKFNDELNELINKNMILLKDKPLQKQRKTDDKVRVLQEQLKSGATALEVVENEYERLKGRQGQLKEEEYLLIMEKRIEETQEQIKQTSKLIHKYQVEVNSDGKKLSKQQVQKKIAQDLHQIKTMLIQTKKEQEKQEAKLQKLDKMLQDLQGKNSDKEYQLSQQVDAAKEKGIVINVKQAIVRKYEEIKMKVSTTQHHCKSLEGLHKNKTQILHHENEQIKISIRNLESQIKNMYHSIEHSQDESIKVIKKSKQNPRLNTHIGENLDKILKYLEQNQNNAYFDVRSEGNHSQASQRPLKKSMYDNMNKDSRNSASKNPSKPHKTEPPNDQINLMKPNFLKKKGQQSQVKDEEDQTNKLYERVWSQEQEKRQKQQERKKAQEEEEKKREQQKKKLAEQDKKKPFTLKKNRLKNNQDKSVQISPREEQEKKVEAPPAKEEEKPTIGPKFTRFNRRERNSEKNDLSIDKPEQKTEMAKIAEELPKQEPPKQEEQAIFKPKRFNLRNKLEKKDDSYVPSVQAKKEEPKVEENYGSKPSNKEEYIPKLSYKQEEPFKIPQVPKVADKLEAKIEEPEQKPIVPLRLRNRQRINNVEETGYNPTRNQPEAATNQKNIDSGYNPTKREASKQKIEQTYVPSYKRVDKQQPKANPYAPKPAANNPYAPSSIEQKPKELNNPYANKQQPTSNPYAPAVEEKPITNPYAPKEDAPKREKEGPVKKIKIQNKAPKQKFNIYEQAEDLTAEPASQPINIPANQPVKEKPVYNVNLINTGDLNLDAMLGKEKKKQTNDYGDLLGEVKVDKKKQKKKNANDFFNDLLLD